MTTLADLQSPLRELERQTPDGKWPFSKKAIRFCPECCARFGDIGWLTEPLVIPEPRFHGSAADELVAYHVAHRGWAS